MPLAFSFWKLEQRLTSGCQLSKKCADVVETTQETLTSLYVLEVGIL